MGIRLAFLVAVAELGGCCLKPVGTTQPLAADAGRLDAGPTPDAGPRTDCSIEGSDFTDGELNPTDACQSCQVASNPSAWSNAVDGSPCAKGGVCIQGACASGCFIDGNLVPLGSTDPGGCRECRPVKSPMGWTDLPDGTLCGAADAPEICYSGACQPGCYIAGAPYAPNQIHGANACQSCVPLVSTDQWTNQPAGTPCANGGVCLEGACGKTSGGCTPGTASDLTQAISYTSNQYFLLASGDLDGDGLLDLVAVLAHGGGFDVFLAEAAGGLAAATHYEGADGNAVTVGDANGDGVPDVVTANGAGINVFLNDGQGGLAAPVFSSAARQVHAIGIGDFNGDGHPDVVLAERDATTLSAELLLGREGGGFSAPSALPGGGGSPFGGLAVADLDGDGLPDLALGSSDDTGLTVMLNRGDGTFTSKKYGEIDPNQVALLPNPQGPPDLVEAVYTGLQVLENSGQGIFTAAFQGTDRSPQLTVGDFNGDCIPDVAVADFSNCQQTGRHLTVYYGDGALGFGSPVSLQVPGLGPAGLAPLGPTDRPRALAVGDVCGGGITVYGDTIKH